MTLTQLEYIIAIDEHRSFQGAARHCFVTQPTLSMQVQKLEEHLGVNIFDRSKNPVMPTSIGQIIIEQARIILRERDKVNALIKTARDVPEGQLKIGIIPTLAPYLLPRFIRDFLKSFPNIKLDVFEYTTEVLVDKLKKGQLDAGMLVTPLCDVSLNEEVLFFERLYLYLSENHNLLKVDKMTPELLSGQDLWLLQEGHCLRTQVINFCDLQTNEDISSNFNYASGSIDTLIRLVDNGNGSTIIPALAVEHLNDLQRQRIRSFASPVPVRQISMVTYRRYLHKHLLDNLKISVQKSIPEEMLISKESKIIDL